MNLYILRHASAGTRRANPVVDVKRPLDKEGKQQCILVGSFLSALNIQFDRVVSSPLKRALQTASLVGTETEIPGPRPQSDEIRERPGRGPQS
jgi:phosphohistidine phosphatase